MKLSKKTLSLLLASVLQVLPLYAMEIEETPKSPPVQSID